MLQGALIKFDKTVVLRKNCNRNGLMCIFVHKTRRQKKYGLPINDLLLFTVGLHRSLIISISCEGVCSSAKLQVVGWVL